MIDYMDEQIQRAFDYLKEIGEYDNTMIVFFSDNGEELYEHDNDPMEFFNLTRDPAHASVLESIRAQFEMVRLRAAPPPDSAHVDGNSSIVRLSSDAHLVTHISTLSPGSLDSLAARESTQPRRPRTRGAGARRAGSRDPMGPLHRGQSG